MYLGIDNKNTNEGNLMPHKNTHVYVFTAVAAGIRTLQDKEINVPFGLLRLQQLQLFLRKRLRERERKRE